MSDGPERRARRIRAKVALCALAREMAISAPYLVDLERGFRPFSPELQERHDRALAKLKNPTMASV